MGSCRHCFAGAVCVAAALLGLACDRGERAAPQGAAAPPPPTVSVATPLVRDVVDWDEYVGRLDAVDSVDVRARVSGFIQAVHFKDGDRVKQGALLFTIDPAPFQAAVNQANAQINTAQSQLELAQSDLRRMEQARATNAVSQADYDKALYTAKADQANVAAAKANAETAKLNLGYTQVTAPIAGKIGRRLVTPGNLITGGGGASTTGAAGASPTLLTTITSLDPIYCYFQADENSVLKYRRLAREHKRVSAVEAEIPCYLTLSDGTEYAHPGVIDFVDNHVDPATGTLTARARFPNPGPTYELTPGMFGRVRVEGSGHYTALLVSDEAVGTDQARRYVYVVGAGDKVEYRPVTVAGLHDGLRAITAGLARTDRVIVNGLLRARPGAVVTPDLVPMPTAPIAPKLAAPASQPSSQPTTSPTAMVPLATGN